MTTYAIKPVAKPRQTRSDKWNKRACVLEYRAFADEIRWRCGTQLELNGSTVTFAIAMPRSWPEKKRLVFDGQPHQAKPDLDNLAKALLDALHPNDSHIHTITLRKVWARAASITIDMPKKTPSIAAGG